jgi:DNA-binding NtrC family response regulator
MRGGPRARAHVTIDVRTFGWDRAVLATLRHSTLPLDGVEGVPLAGIRDLGKRDRLSLLGQFAAHQALLQSAGIGDGAFDADEWRVVQRRGLDCRLVRIRGRRASTDPIPVLTVVQQFAEGVGAPELDVLRQSSARAEAVYCEIDGRLRNDATADLRWFRAAAMGQIASPGIDGLRTVLTSLSGQYRFDDDECMVTLRIASDDVIVLGEQSSPLARFSGLAGLLAGIEELGEAEVVERIIAMSAQRRLLFVIASEESLDASSRKVIDLLQAGDTGVWIGANGTPLRDSKWFVISPRLTARQHLDATIAAIPREIRRAKIAQFIDSPCFARYLADGVLPAPQLVSPTAAIKEPARSYLAAIALLGVSMPVAIAQTFLDGLSSSAKIGDLVFEDVSAIFGGIFGFASEDMRQAALQHLPVASRASLARTAAEMLSAAGDREGAALLFAESGDMPQSIEILESVDWRSPADAIRVLRTLRSDTLSPKLARALAIALIDAGRYRDAREVIRDDEALLARVERRTGDYAAAIARLEKVHRTFDDELLYADLLNLTGRAAEAEAACERCSPSSDRDRVLLGYQRAVLAVESGRAPDREWLRLDSGYYAARFQMYEAITAHDTGAALAFAEEATATAGTMADRIDATLDYLFALFSAGRWTDARNAALDGLLIADETQGDRAAGGILFLLAYLCADDGQCAHASHLLDRLQQFYADVHDDRRLQELHLISAAIELSRGRFDAARAAAEALLAGTANGQVREAAALIADEVASITQSGAPLRATGRTANIELTDRFKLLRDVDGAQRPFIRALTAWRNGSLPATESAADKLLLMRTALRRNQRDVAESMAIELGVALDHSQHAGDSELRMLRIAMTRDFPFGAHDFAPAKWRFASRNRLGQWTEIGSLQALTVAELDAILEEPGADWVACSDHELLFFESLSGWSADSRKALASTFRTRAEHYRLRRLIEQDQQAPQRAAEALDGIVGQSPGIQEICDLVSRVAKRDVPVCILGESGTGKELIARAIHRQSPRRHKPFTTVNCAALPENLIESELFGTARGAYTGADRDRAGLIETTEGGTLFLDEIGEMPLAAQAKLLRFLQEGEFRRVGETTLRAADVRILTATNRKLETAVEAGRFREDLYYRIRGVEVTVPPLRDRTPDIPLLTSHFLAREREKHRGGPSRLSSEAEAAFASYHWPGNVRELQNAVRASHAIAGDAKQIELDHLPPALRRLKIVRKSLGSYQDAIVRFRRDLIEKSLAQANGNQNQAAAMLKISRQALAYQIRELGILVMPLKRPRRPL